MTETSKNNQTKKKQCPFCGGMFDPRGYGSHVASCKDKRTVKAKDNITVEKSVEPDEYFFPEFGLSVKAYSPEEAEMKAKRRARS